MHIVDCVYDTVLCSVKVPNPGYLKDRFDIYQIRKGERERERKIARRAAALGPLAQLT